jgi:hypothetical protein
MIDVKIRHVSIGKACDGNINLVNGVTPVPAKFFVTGLLTQGWLAKSSKEGEFCMNRY